jgi:hypothetical protein
MYFTWLLISFFPGKIIYSDAASSEEFTERSYDRSLPCARHIVVYNCTHLSLGQYQTTNMAASAC